MISSVHRILKFSGKYALRIRAAYLFSFLKSFCSNAPLMIAVLTINMLMGKTLTVISCFYIAAAMLILLLFGAFFHHITDRLQSSAGYEMFAEKRLMLGEHLKHLPMDYFTAGHLGKISSLLSNDMVFIEENSMNIVADVLSDLFSQLLIVVFLYFLHPYFSAAALSVFVLAALISIPMQKSDRHSSIWRQSAIEKLSDSVIEYTEGQSVIKGYRITGESAHKLRDDFREMTDANLAYESKHMPWERSLEILYALGITGLILLDVWLMQTGEISAADFIGLVVFIFSIFAPIRHMFQMNTRIAIMNISLDRIEALFSEPTIDDSGTEALPEKAEHEIEFCGVSFAYDENDVLKNISFTAEKGQMTALVGQSGSGKTTIASLIARFRDIENGEILIRGKNIKSIPIQTLTDQLGIVFQRVYLFHDTVYENIAMGKKNVTREQVYSAAKKARCYDFIMKLPFGFDTVIGEGGSTLSGGEAQRISIARCILKDSPIIILDEATASVDADNEKLIGEALSELCRDKTLIVIAHRLNTIHSADKIIVLDDGKIDSVGTHDSLIKESKLYRRLVNLADETAVLSGRGE